MKIVAGDRHKYILIAYEINFDTTKFSKLFHAYTQLRLTYEVEDFFLVRIFLQIWRHSFAVAWRCQLA